MEVDTVTICRGTWSFHGPFSGSEPFSDTKNDQAAEKTCRLCRGAVRYPKLGTQVNTLINYNLYTSKYLANNSTVLDLFAYWIILVTSRNTQLLQIGPLFRPTLFEGGTGGIHRLPKSRAIHEGFHKPKRRNQPGTT